MPEGGKTPTVLSVRGLAKAFGTRQVLRGVDLDVGATEVVALVGENGAGKSTLVRCVAGGLRPDDGEILVPRGPGSIAVVWQDLALCDNLDVVANLFLGREQRLVAEAEMEAEARRLLARLGVAIDDLRRPVGVLSGGQRQLVAVARALAGRPDVVILDEPTAALGIAAARRVEGLVRELRSAGVAILLVSHRPEQVFDLADRIAVLRAGRIVAEVSPVEAHPDEVTALMEGLEVESTARRQLRRLRGLVDQLAGVEPSASLPLIVSAAASALGQDKLCVHLISAAGGEPGAPADAEDRGASGDAGDRGASAFPLGRVLRRYAAVGLAEPLLAVTGELPVGPGGGPVGLAAEAGSVVVVEDVISDPAWEPFRHLGSEAGVASCWAAPIVGDTGLLGIVSGYGTTPGRPRADLLELVSLYAGYAAAAIERGRLLAEVTRRNQILETLRAMLETLAGPDRLRGGLEVALLALCRGLGADAAALGESPRAGVEVVLASGQDAERARLELRSAAEAALAGGHPGDRPRYSDQHTAAVALTLPDGPAVLAAWWAEPVHPGPEALDLLDDAARSLRLAIEREDLEAAHREAEALRRSHSLQRDFLSRVSHELRTPLTAIRGYASSLRQPDVTWDAASEDRFLTAIAAESARMSRLVADLLDSSAIESGVLRLDPDWCDLGLVLRTALACIPAEQASLVELSCDPLLGPLWGDHDRLEQVFVNLIENGLRHTAPGTRVRVTAGPGQRAGTVAVRVADNGPGIPPEEAERLFQPWTRGRTEGSGAGLGLSIVRGIVEAHGGRVQLEPVPSGASFLVELPAEPPPMAEEAAPRLAGVPERRGR